MFIDFWFGYIYNIIVAILVSSCIYYHTIIIYIAMRTRSDTNLSPIEEEELDYDPSEPIAPIVDP